MTNKILRENYYQTFICKLEEVNMHGRKLDTAAATKGHVKFYNYELLKLLM